MIKQFKVSEAEILEHWLILIRIISSRNAAETLGKERNEQIQIIKSR